MAHIRYGNQQAKLSLLVVIDDGANPLGRDWLQHLRLDWQQINRLHSEALQQVLHRQQDVSKDGLGTLERYKAKIHIIPGRPWACLHLDFAKPFRGQMFLVLTDAHSKWLDVHPMPISTTEDTIHHLRIIFAEFSLPERFVTDNELTLISWEFKNFFARLVLKIQYLHHTIQLQMGWQR